jgi:AcrR family transcriptional regulator
MASGRSGADPDVNQLELLYRRAGRHLGEPGRREHRANGGFEALVVGVSVQTVYKAFGNKARLAKAVFDVAMAGDDDAVPMLQRASLSRVRDEPDARAKFRLYGEFLAEVAPRHVPVQLVIRDAATSDPEAREAWAQLQAERLNGMTLFARALHDDGHLRPGVSANEARDVLWTYNSAELFQLLVLERGWSPKRYGRWIAAGLISALLPDPGEADHR